MFNPLLHSVLFKDTRFRLKLRKKSCIGGLKETRFSNYWTSIVAVYATARGVQQLAGEKIKNR